MGAQLGGCLGALTAQPLGQFDGVAATRRVKWRQPLPARDPVQLGTAVQQVGRAPLLSAVAGTPEGAVDLLRRWRLGAGEVPLQAIQQPQRRRIVDGGLRTALDQPLRGLPLPERPGVRQRGAAGDDAAGRLDVGARVDERVQHLHVVAAGRPVQRRLLVRAVEPGVDSAPASTRSATVAAPLGKWPGQSVATCSRVRDVPAGSSSPIRAVANPGCSASSRRSAARSPRWIASITATASGSCGSMVTLCLPDDAAGA